MIHAEKVAQVSRALEAVGLTVYKSGPPEADIYVSQACALVRVGRGFPPTESSVKVLTIADVDPLSITYLRQKLYQLLMGYELPSSEGGPRLRELSEGEIEAVRRNVLYAFQELSEFLNEFPWKWHRDTKPVDRMKVVEEFGDGVVFL
ncbi:hypothetical protein LCGC14_2388570, partial [marine sediment metagenome]